MAFLSRNKPICTSGRKSLREKPEIYDQIKHSHSFYLPESLLRKLAQEAKSQNTSASEVFEQILRITDTSEIRPISLLTTRSQSNKKLRTSFALTNTAYEVLQRLQQKGRLRSVNLAAEILLREILEIPFS